MDKIIAALCIGGSIFALCQYMYAVVLQVSDVVFVAPSVVIFLVTVVYNRLSRRQQRGPVDSAISRWLCSPAAKYMLLLLTILLFGEILYFLLGRHEVDNAKDSYIVQLLLSITALGVFVSGAFAALGYEFMRLLRSAP